MAAWKIIRDIWPKTIKEDFNWIINDQQALRHNRRINLPRYRSSKLQRQCTNSIGQEINNLQENDLNLRIGAFKNKLKKDFRNENINFDPCHNRGCIECAR